MALYRAQVVHKHTSGLPKDSFVNTFHVTSPTADEADAEAIAEAVRDFYTTTPTGFGGPLNGMFGDQVAIAGHEVKMYPLNTLTGVQTAGDGQPPQWVESFDHVGRTQDTANVSAPSEVAICLSYKSGVANAVPARRKRGRIFIGPLHTAMIDEAVGGRPRVSSDTRSHLVAQAEKLSQDLGAGGYAWVVYSRPFGGRPYTERVNQPDLPELPARVGATYNITDVWVDDAFDTQRRRGEAAVTRTTNAF